MAVSVLLIAPTPPPRHDVFCECQPLTELDRRHGMKKYGSIGTFVINNCNFLCAALQVVCLCMCVQVRILSFGIKPAL
jgi:hypothetical protein